MNTILETIYDDGNYTALIGHYGKQFAVHFVNGEVRISGVAGVSHAKRWAINASVKAIRAAVVERIKAQGPAFIEAHKALYGVTEVAL